MIEQILAYGHRLVITLTDQPNLAIDPQDADFESLDRVASTVHGDLIHTAKNDLPTVQSCLQLKFNFLLVDNAVLHSSPSPERKRLHQGRVFVLESILSTHRHTLSFSVYDTGGIREIAPISVSVTETRISLQTRFTCGQETDTIVEVDHDISDFFVAFAGTDST